MNVAQLIEHLKQFDPEMLVAVEYHSPYASPECGAEPLEAKRVKVQQMEPDEFYYHPQAQPYVVIG